jgi:uncharacterized protein (DUF2062 family)
MITEPVASMFIGAFAGAYFGVITMGIVLSFITWIVKRKRKQ